jgi:hypothetical protein
MTTLSGRVLVHGEPAKIATVEIHNPNGDVVDQIQVDDEGRYTYHLSPGEWSLKVWDAYGHRGAAEVSLQEGDDKVFDVELEEPEGGHG